MEILKISIQIHANFAIYDKKNIDFEIFESKNEIFDIAQTIWMRVCFLNFEKKMKNDSRLILFIYKDWGLISTSVRVTS